MNTQQIDEILDSQRRFFESGATLSLSFRLKMLRLLREAIRRWEDEIAEALRTDLGKSRTESYMCEIGLVLSEISYLLRHTKKFAAERRVRTPLSQFAAKSYEKPSPYGTTLIMSPWNYPLLLTLEPLADALAAGNTAIVKPSAYSPATSAVIEKLLTECFPPHYVAAVTGGRQENACLLEKKFDFVFFTGSQAVGREVLRRTAETLTPAVLELGGKSPCIVDETAKLKLAARRIVFGKYLNCGQTCVAPDYLLCHASVKEALLAEIKREIGAQFGEEPLDNPAYGRIVNEKHFRRLSALLDDGKIIAGGRTSPETLRISPTLLDGVSWDDPVMQEEIFGPILPVLTFDDFDDVFSLLAGRPKPLALYLFTEDKKRAKTVVERASFGGGCVNDTIIHLATSELGFGGVGESGMGAYHGKRGFETFSHIKSIVNKKTWIDLPMRYQPYTEAHEKAIRSFLH